MQRYSFFFGEHLDALPMYEKLEEQILSRIPVLMIMMNNENGLSDEDLKEKALSAIITKTDTDWS